jgi:DNA-binding PucR family transcriptional regulator
MHRSKDSWPVLPRQIKDLFRKGAELALTLPEENWDELHQATFAGLRSKTAIDDPVLFEATKRVNVANLRRWAASNVANPGERVTPRLGPEAVNLTRDMVRRGLDSRSLDSYRTSQSVAWRLWMDICFTLTGEVEELKELLDVSALSISTYLDDTVDELVSRVEADLRDLSRGTNAERMATLSLVLEGAPITQAHAESRLGYRLTGAHTAIVIWSDVGEDDARTDRVASDLEAVADGVMQANNCARRLTLVASARSLWVWLPTDRVRTTGPLPAVLTAAPGVRLAIGRAGRGLGGFRRSHLDATVTQRMIARITSPERVARYEDVQLVILMTTDLAKADEFVADTLGGLASATPEILETVSTYIREQFNASRTAEHLYTHRNTVLRRLERADQLLPRPLAENITNVAAALDVVRLRPSGGARSTAPSSAR